MDMLYSGANLEMYGNDKDAKGSFLGINEDLNTGEMGELSPVRDNGIKPKGIVSINNIDPQTDPNDCETVLEYILTTISQAMGLNPKQAAGLLSNNNKFLVHVCVKGVKGDFEKISQWYQTIYSTCRHLAELIDREEEQGTVTLAMKIVSAGLFSPNYEIVVWCLRVLSKIGSELDIRKLLGNAYEWFIEQDGGLSAIIYATNKHSDILENVVSVMTQFGKYNMLELFNLHLKNLSPDQAQYMDLITDIYSTVAETFIAKEALVSSGVIDFWIDTAIQQADGDFQSTIAEKTSALSFLAEVWITKNERVQAREDISETILRLLNRGSRDRSKLLKFVCFSILFKLLDTFTSDKNNYAPKIYKSLTFLCVENHQNNDVREFMFKNFSDVFTNIKNIPIAILLESLMKQITISGNVTYHFNIFDFEFFKVVAMHPRLHLKLAIDFVDMLGKIICNDVTFSNSASESFMIILRRYHDHETMQLYMRSFTKVAMKFISNFEKQKIDLAKTHRLEGDKLKTGKGNSIRQISNPEDQKMKWIQKTLFINLLKNVIENIGSIHLNGMLKPEIIKTYIQIQRKHKIKHKGLLVLIELFGNADAIIAEYKEANKNKSLERDDQDIDLVSIRSHQVQNNLKQSIGKRKDSTENLDHNHINLSVQHHSSKMSPLKQKSMRNIKQIQDDTSELNFSVLSDVPHRLRANQEKLMYQPDSITMGNYRLKNKLTKQDERALKEIEKVKMRRQRRLEDQLFEEERKQMQQEKLKNQIHKELERRNVEHGVVPNSKKAFKKKNLIRDTSVERDDTTNRKKPKIELYDFSLEEEKDKNDIYNFLQKYKKLLNHLFKTYASTGFTHKNVNSFDAMHNRLESMSLSECTMMLKKNSVIPELLHKEEAATILRMVNVHITGDKRENKSLSGKHFPQFFLQIAMFVFGRAPINLSQKPPIESVKALLKLFEKSTFHRGESIKLYENPDHTILADSDMIKELNKILKQNPNHPMPDGFRKVKIKEYKSIYKVPDYMPIAEPNKIALEIIDELLSKQFGFHIFEPLNEPYYKYEAKPILDQLMKHPVGKKNAPYKFENAKLPPKSKRKLLEPIPTRAYKGDRGNDRSVQRKDINSTLPAKTRGSKNNRSVPAARSIPKYPESEGQTIRKRVYNDVPPDLSLSVRLEVVKYPMHVRDYVQEVAETLEEILEAASKGLTQLPPRKKFGIQSYMNQAQIMKKQREETEKKKEERKNQKYEAHKVELQERLEKMKAEKSKQLQENKQKEKQLRSKKKEKQKKKQAEVISERDDRIKSLQDKKKTEDQEKKKKEEMKQKIQIELDKRKEQNRKDFLSKRKSQMRKEFQNLSKQRQGNLTEEEQLNLDKEMRKEKEKKLKEYFDKQKELKAQNEAAKKDYLGFYDSPNIQKVFEDNFNTVSESYLKFSKQQKYSKKAQPSDFQMNFNAFKKFGHDMKIYPNIISFDELSHIFKTLSKEKTDKRKSVKANDEEIKENEKDSLHITFGEFKDALTRISCLAKYKLGGLQGVSDEDAKNKDTELKSYLKNRWNKGASKKNDSKPADSSKKSKLSQNLNKSQLPSKNETLTKQGSKADLKDQKSGRYLFDKPAKLSKEEQAKKERELTMNAAKSFSLKNFKNNARRESSVQKGTSIMPSIIYEDTELFFPEIDSEFMTHATVESLVNYLKQVLEAEKNGGKLDEVKLEKAENNSAGAKQADDSNNTGQNQGIRK